MYQLPLFPLNTVLFPDMPIDLHIFEPRYLLMVSRCLANQQPFGIVLIHTGLEANGALAEPYSVGTTARISGVERLADGRMNLVVIGEERFEILSLDRSGPYLVAQVQALPLDLPQTLQVQRGMRHLTGWVEQYLRLLKRILPGKLNLTPSQLPGDALVIMYLAAALLQVPAREKQPLLAAANAADLQSKLLRLYRRECMLMPTMAAVKPETSVRQAWLS